MKLIFIRHSKTTINFKIPITQWELSEEGKILAKELSYDERIKNVDLIYSSDQKKAIQTAEIIAQTNDIPMKIEPHLTELSSITNGIIENFDEVVHDFNEGNIDRINDGETIEEGFERFNSAVNKIVKLNGDKKTIGIVSHGEILSIYLSKKLGKSINKIHENMKMPHLFVINDL